MHCWPEAWADLHLSLQEDERLLLKATVMFLLETTEKKKPITCFLIKKKNYGIIKRNVAKLQFQPPRPSSQKQEFCC